MVIRYLGAVPLIIHSSKTGLALTVEFRYQIKMELIKQTKKLFGKKSAYVVLFKEFSLVL